MKKTFLVAALSLAALTSVGIFSAFSQKTMTTPSTTITHNTMESYTKEWKKVDSLLNIGQLQSAQAIIDTILQITKQQNNIPQFIKATIYRLGTQNLYQEDSFAKNSIELEQIIHQAAFPAKNILHSLAADLYWQYYQQNRWQFSNRSTMEVTPEDVRTWDLRTIVEKCEAHYSASLEQADKLQQMNIGNFNGMLDKATDSEKYRPTLFDFLAFRAVDFYSSNDAGITQPAAQFIVADKAYFLPAADFCSYRIITTDSLSFTFQAVSLLQNIIAFHLNDDNPTALIDADIQRLDIVYAACTLPEKDSLYLSALQKLDARYAADPASTEILYRIASLFREQGDTYVPYTNTAPQWKKKEAMEVIEQAAARFPKSFGAKNCLALKNQLQQPSITIATDDAVLPRQPILAGLEYKNVQKLYYRIIPLVFKKTLEQDDGATHSAVTLAQNKALKSGVLPLPDNDDYQTHSLQFALPELPEGYYSILIGTDEHFTQETVMLAEKRIWVTAISYVQKDPGSMLHILALHRETGAPMSGLKAQAYTQEYNYNKRRYEVKYGETYTTDEEGGMEISAGNDYRRLNLIFTDGKDQYATPNTLYAYSYQYPDQSEYITTFFTDRAIYRPGQTIYFKGVILKRRGQEVETVKNRKQTVTFYNANYQEVSDVTLTTNEFGSFAGSFVIPNNGLTGQMSLQTSNGSIYFQVEEYKRPKFEMAFNKVKDTYRLGATVTVNGYAKTYAGSAVSEAKVTYRVTRQARYPYWGWWWGPQPGSSAQEILNGETVTNNDGSFTVAFTALPDAGIAKKDAPVFHYNVYAVITDINGETHEAQTTVPVGYQSLTATVNIPQKVNLDEWKEVDISINNLNGEAQATQGTLRIWKLRAPDRILRERKWGRPDQFVLSRPEFEKLFPNDIYDDENNVGNWEKEQEVFTVAFDTRNTTTYVLPDSKKWPAGNYLITLSTQDIFGEPVENTVIVTGFSPSQKSVPAKEPVWFEVMNPVAQPGEVVKIAIGSAYKNTHVYIETIEDALTSKRQTIRLNDEQRILEIPVKENNRGNFGIALFFVRDNRSYSASKIIQVPYENKKLQLEFATFRDKLQPGHEEEWRITIKNKAGDAVTAELLASMYDASLDVFAANNWHFFPWNNKSIYFSWNTANAFYSNAGRYLTSNYVSQSTITRYYSALRPVTPVYGFWEEEIMLNDVVVTGYGRSSDKAYKRETVAAASVAEDGVLLESVATEDAAEEPTGMKTETELMQVEQPVQVRTNFNETAFFYPQLKTNEKGETVISFTIPEALSRWKMQGLAWTQDLATGYIQKELVTQKELMIFTNPPRFFRENDTIYFSAKLTNISDKALQVKTQVQFFDALTMQPVSGVLLEDDTHYTSLTPEDNKGLSWKLFIPEGLQALTYRITALSDGFSDGEENTIPVLTNRMLVTESLPLPIRSHQTKTYEFTKLIHHKSNTLNNYAYTVEFTSNPAWNAVQALPYIMEYPYECAEQAFSRYYAYAIATHIVNSDPKIKQVFDNWRNYQPTALSSNLEKNEALKMVLLEETPWVRAAQNEKERKQRIAALFDLNRMTDELGSVMRKVQQAQTSNGGFAWFKGGPDNRYITQHIVAGIGHLQKMGIATTASGKLLTDAIRYMDTRLAEDFNKLKERAKKDKKDYTKEAYLDYPAIHYLYARSFFVEKLPIPKTTQEAFDFYKKQAVAYWAKNNNYMKGMLALALNRYGDGNTARLIMKSLSESALHSEEMGMYWRNEPQGWWWYQAPVETHALLIEAYNEVINDRKAVDELKVWLLKQKQTQDWKTTKATSEAIYALLQTGSDLLASNELCEITVGGHTVDPNKLEGGNKPEAGTGYFQVTWHGKEIQPEMGKITVKNPNPTVAWGAAYWQYFEQLDKITPAETGVKIAKKLLVKTNTSTGPVLKEINEKRPIKVGDKVVVRIEIRADRDMEYVHLKDMRAAAFEPINVLSGYRWQDGLGYYESTRDAATNFFIAYLPKGVYVFEYELFATQKGEFSNGITSLQCMYAPEFTAHSEGTRIIVTENQ